MTTPEQEAQTEAIKKVMPLVLLLDIAGIGAALAVYFLTSKVWLAGAVFTASAAGVALLLLKAKRSANPENRQSRIVE